MHEGYFYNYEIFLKKLQLSHLNILCTQVTPQSTYLGHFSLTFNRLKSSYLISPCQNTDPNTKTYSENITFHASEKQEMCMHLKWLYDFSTYKLKGGTKGAGYPKLVITQI